MDFSDLLDDELMLPSAEGYKVAMKALQETNNKVNQRSAKQKQVRAKLAQQERDLQDVLVSMEDHKEGLNQQQQQLQDMQAKVEEHLGMGDNEAGGPEPDTWLQALQPVQALPTLQLQDICQLSDIQQQQRQLLGLPDDSSSDGTTNPAQVADAFAWLLAQGGGLAACPSEAVARATFAAVCYGPNSLALAAFNRFMAWCGEPEVVAGSQASSLSQLYQWASGAFTRPPTSTLPVGTALADALPPTTITWLPSATDMLEALTALGLQQQSQKQLPSAEPSQQQQQQVGQQQEAQLPDGFAFRYSRMPLLLRLVCCICRAHAAGRLNASELAANQGQYLQLLLGLLTLMLDQQALVTCRCFLTEAFAALLEVPTDTAWDRLVRDTGPGSLLAALSGGLGPSHRSAVHLLRQMPRSACGNALRQLGALQLLAKLIPKAKRQAPPCRINSMDRQELRQSLHQGVRRLLGPHDKIRQLLLSLSEPAEPGGQLNVAALTSVLEAADLVLWVDVSTPGVGISRELHSWFLEWLAELDKLLSKKLTHHRATAKVATMLNAYHFASLGCVVVG